MVHMLGQGGKKNKPKSIGMRVLEFLLGRGLLNISCKCGNISKFGLSVSTEGERELTEMIQFETSEDLVVKALAKKLARQVRKEAADQKIHGDNGAGEN